jgi:hypothetical protein
LILIWPHPQHPKHPHVAWLLKPTTQGEGDEGVELYEKIRKAHRDEGLGIRALSARIHVHRRTVPTALAWATPPARKLPERTAPVLGPWQDLVRQWLIEDRLAPPRQRHTGHRVWTRLTAECAAVVAESTVRAYVAQVRAELEDHLGK